MTTGYPKAVDPDVIETKNLSLEETAALFDGEDAIKELTHTHVENGLGKHDSSDEKLSDEAVVPDLHKS